MREILGRLKYYAAMVLFLLTSSVLSVGPAVLSSKAWADPTPTTSPLYYTGQGLPLQQQCDNNYTPYLQFNFTFGGNNNPTNVALNGIAVTSQTEQGSNIHFITPYVDPSTLINVVNVTWDGIVGNGQLVISHGCSGAPATTVIPTAVQFTEPTCDTAGFFTIPSQTGVVYEDAAGNTLTAGDHPVNPGQTVTINAVSAGSAYVLTGTTTWTHTFTTPTNCTVTVTPTTPTVTVAPICGLTSEVVTPPTITGVIWSPVGSTTLAIGQSVTYTATPAPGYVFPVGAQTSFTITNDFDIHSCDTVGVTLCHATDSRKNPYEIITVDAAGAYNGHLGHTGPIFSPSLPKHTKWGDIIPTFTYGGTTYSLNWDATGQAILNNGCKIAPTVVTPQPPTATTPSCYDPTETVTPPTITGIIWSPNHATTLLPGMSVTYKAKAAAGYVLAPGSQTRFTFKNTFDPLSCTHLPTVVIPTPPTATTPSCEVPSEIVTPPSIPGIVWSPSGSTTLQPGESVTYTASAAYGYVIAVGAQTQFTVHNNFQTESCGGGGVTPLNPTITVTPGACVPTVLPTGTAMVTITNPNNYSVDYLVDLGNQEQMITVDGGQTGQVTFTGLAAGTYTVTVRGDDDTMHATGSVTIVACPVTPPSGGGGGGHVLGASTTAASTVTELANTGTSVVLPTILAVSMALTATGVMLGDYMRRKSAASDPTL